MTEGAGELEGADDGSVVSRVGVRGGVEGRRGTESSKGGCGVGDGVAIGAGAVGTGSEAAAERRKAERREDDLKDSRRLRVRNGGGGEGEGVMLDMLDLFNPSEEREKERCKGRRHALRLCPT